jgi:hypothetical protein
MQSTPGGSGRFHALGRKGAWAVAGGVLLLAGGCGQASGADKDVGATSQAINGENNGEGSGGGDNYGEPGAALNLPPDPHWDRADDLIIAPIWRGNTTKGQLYTPLWRGAFPGVEEAIYTPPDGDCRDRKLTVRVDWDSVANTVHFLIKGKNVVQYPSVTRTAGTEWQYNPFHPTPQNVVHGAYRMWIIEASVTNAEELWYDANTLNLVATSFTAATQPANTIPVQFPAFSITGTHQFEPDSHGFVSHQFTEPYSAFTVEGGLYARDWVTFAPLDLCESLPLQPAVSQLRPVASPWIPAAQAPTFLEILQSGLSFDVHVEEQTDPTVNDGNLPYVYSGISAYGNHPGMQGGIPNGGHLELTAAILNVAPTIDPVPFGNGLGCQQYVNEARFSAPLYCQGQQ